jgi:N-acetyl-anhydromuramyl-L-alanine amidase AmpD
MAWYKDTGNPKVIWYKNLRNKRYSGSLGWDPTWFNAEKFDKELVDKIINFQLEYDISPDGICGPRTFRIISTEREMSQIDDKAPSIICDGQRVPVEWDKVVNLLHSRAEVLPDNCYRKYKSYTRNVKMVVTHFDVCLSAKSCKKILEKKGISSHFVIDNDGTIYQMVDPKNEAWHAGKRSVNRVSIGIDISNGVYPKYQKWYRKAGFGVRPVLQNVEVHGTKVKECLGFYPVQLKAFKNLLQTLCKYYNIPIEMPMTSLGKVSRRVESSVAKGKFAGIVNHYHVTRKKWDVANLDWDEFLSDLRENKS